VSFTVRTVSYKEPLGELDAVTAAANKTRQARDAIEKARLTPEEQHRKKAGETVRSSREYIDMMQQAIEEKNLKIKEIEAMDMDQQSKDDLIGIVNEEFNDLKESLKKRTSRDRW
jgi:CHASE3 domain sensor protein